MIEVIIEDYEINKHLSIITFLISFFNSLKNSSCILMIIMYAANNYINALLALSSLLGSLKQVQDTFSSVKSIQILELLDYFFEL